jgi:small conductance mechanosensitive channel
LKELPMDLNLAEAPAELSASAAMLWAWSVEFLPRLGAALLILVIGLLIAAWASRLVGGVARRTPHVDPTLVPVLGTVVRYAILILVLVVALGQLGVQTASLLAVLGAAGLAIGLALQGTLQNIAAGIILLYLRPFRIGDTIETPAVMGKVEQIGLFVTHLQTLDGLFYFVPNSALWNVPLKNHTRNPRRQISVQLRVGYDADLGEVRRILTDMASAEERVLADQPPQVFVDSYTDAFVIVTLRAWVPTSDFLLVQRALAEEAKRRLQAASVKISA